VLKLPHLLEVTVKIHIINFQSIEDVSFEIPEKSFTCIVGPSNIGKSAIRRALECLMYNNSDASFIRNGAKSCSIEVTFGDGSVIKWYRDKKTAGYIIDGDDFTKLAGSVPDLLIDKGYKELIINKDKYQVQIASQFNNIFLLNETGGKVTEVLSNLGNLNRIIKSNKSCQTDLKVNKNRLSVRREDIISAKEKLKSYKGLDDQKQLVSVLKTHLKEIRETKNKLYTIKKIETSLNKSVDIVRILRPAKDIDVTSFDLDLNKVTNLNNLLKKLTRTQKVVDSYAPIKNIATISLDISADNLKVLKALLPKLTVYEKKQTHFSKLSEIPKIDFNLKEEYDQYLNLITYSKKLEIAKNKIELYKNLTYVVPSLEDLDISMLKRVSALCKSVSETKDKVLSLRDQLNDSEVKLTKLEEERDNLHKTLGVCPLCDKEF
jgi:DNA repair ATPase RecN